MNEPKRPTWDEIKARSATVDNLFCADCWCAFTVLGSACGRHETSEEHAAFERELSALVMSEHPVFQMIKKD